VVDALGIGDRFHLLGQSWGGMLAPEFMLADGAGVLSLTIADSPASMPLWLAAAQTLRSRLPADVQDTLTRHERAGSTDSAEYTEAMNVFYARHVCRVQPLPAEVAATFAQIEQDPTVYHTMNGPSEFHVIGTLTGWDITPRLRDVRVPVLVISGEHDEATPTVVRPLVDALPDARWELVEGASHSTHLEQPERFLALIETFLSAHDE
jgi:L-proline amide hydrolase